MKQQFVITQTHNSSNCDFYIIRQLGYKHTSSQNLHLQKISFPYIFVKIYLHTDVLRICQVFSVSCKTVNCWVRTYCCFMSNILCIYDFSNIPLSLWHTYRAMDCSTYVCMYVFTYVHMYVYTYFSPFTSRINTPYYCHFLFHLFLSTALQWHQEQTLLSSTASFSNLPVYLLDWWSLHSVL
jgi:hypothetical protein